MVRPSASSAQNLALQRRRPGITKFTAHLSQVFGNGFCRSFLAKRWTCVYTGTLIAEPASASPVTAQSNLAGAACCVGQALNDQKGSTCQMIWK